MCYILYTDVGRPQRQVRGSRQLLPCHEGTGTYVNYGFGSGAGMWTFACTRYRTPYGCSSYVQYRYRYAARRHAIHAVHLYLLIFGHALWGTFASIRMFVRVCWGGTCRVLYAEWNTLSLRIRRVQSSILFYLTATTSTRSKENNIVL